MTDHQIYSYSLCIALPLMLLFGYDFLFSKVPEKRIYGNFLRSRRTMGIAILLLAANYSVHFFFNIRFLNVNAAILMNLTTYFICYWLFSSALTTLLDRFYITRRRLTAHLLMWAAFSFLAWVDLLLVPDGRWQKAGLFLLAAWLVGYGLLLSARLLMACHRAAKLFDNSHADDIGAYIKWMRKFTYWALVFGVGCGLLTFLPDRLVYVWILSSVPFYIYLYHCYRNYFLFYEMVESAMESEIATENDILGDGLKENNGADDMAAGCPDQYADVAQRVEEWIREEGYRQRGLTIKDVADALYTNRTYLSGYINNVCRTSFRDWITQLRLEYAKRRIIGHPEQKLTEISEVSGFMSISHFMKVFKEKEGISPAKWRKDNAPKSTL